MYERLRFHQLTAKLPLCSMCLCSCVYCKLPQIPRLLFELEGHSIPVIKYALGIKVFTNFCGQPFLGIYIEVMSSFYIVYFLPSLVLHFLIGVKQN